MQYNTKYYYKIGSGDSAREFWFETPPAIDPDASYTFGIIGSSFFFLKYFFVNSMCHRITLDLCNISSRILPRLHESYKIDLNKIILSEGLETHPLFLSNILALG